MAFNDGVLQPIIMTKNGFNIFHQLTKIQILFKKNITKYELFLFIFISLVLSLQSY